MSALSSAARSAISGITGQLTDLLARQTASANEQARQAQEQAERLDAHNEKRVRAIKQRRNRILLLSRVGLRRLMKLSQDPQMIALLEAYANAGRPSHFDFYRASRFSGDAWDHGSRMWQGPNERIEGSTAERIVTITFELTGVSFYSGSNTPGADNNRSFDLNHVAPQKAQEELLAQLIPSVRDGVRGRIGLDHMQLDREWDPDELLIHVLAECAHKRNRDYYLEFSLRQLR